MSFQIRPRRLLTAAQPLRLAKRGVQALRYVQAYYMAWGHKVMRNQEFGDVLPERQSHHTDAAPAVAVDDDDALGRRSLGTATAVADSAAPRGLSRRFGYPGVEGLDGGDVRAVLPYAGTSSYYAPGSLDPDNSANVAGSVAGPVTGPYTASEATAAATAAAAAAAAASGTVDAAVERLRSGANARWGSKRAEAATARERHMARVAADVAARDAIANGDAPSAHSYNSGAADSGAAYDRDSEDDVHTALPMPDDDDEDNHTAGDDDDADGGDAGGGDDAELDGGHLTMHEAMRAAAAAAEEDAARTERFEDVAVTEEKEDKDVARAGEYVERERREALEVPAPDLKMPENVRAAGGEAAGMPEPLEENEPGAGVDAAVAEAKHVATDEEWQVCATNECVALLPKIIQRILSRVIAHVTLVKK